ncbi:UL41 protein [Gallid alphaherpesvirus 3]|uniref:Virion host shutoff protein n=1 Tax=Gallid alphaherpesvirus 3 TaxID=35250 RepID=F8TC38_9ALPH|nr:UL41 protein [Gallid alphaherpesvirus 3]AEI00249.1 UL41 protein [Gallid alphaherpesvirus 3]QEY02244.1 UL41 protein [Gallid alphaherpesvirus 3]
MGVYGCMHFAYANGLVRSHISGSISGGAMTPIAVDLWNVMYGLLEKIYPGKVDGVDNSVATLRCLYCLLRLLHQRSYYPVFVSDRGFSKYGKTLYGAKALAATRIARGGGSGRLQVRSRDECENADTGEARNKRTRKRKRPRRWSDKSDTPKILHRLCMDTIRYMGYPYVDVAMMEADDICANLFHTKTVAYVLSSDTDMLLMGCDIIIDLTRIFPPTIYCRDVLAALKMDYFTFLSNFVRCQTDLHCEHTLKSMQEIIDLGTLKQGSGTICGKASDNERGRSSLMNCCNPEITGGHHYERPADMPDANRDLASNYSLLRSLHPPKTRCEVLEYKFIKHVIATIMPERRTPRISILKRFPIMQDIRDDVAVEELVFRSIPNEAEASVISTAFLRCIPEVRPFDSVLIRYWGRDASQTTRCEKR